MTETKCIIHLKAREIASLIDVSKYEAARRTAKYEDVLDDEAADGLLQRIRCVQDKDVFLHVEVEYPPEIGGRSSTEYFFIRSFFLPHVKSVAMVWNGIQHDLLYDLSRGDESRNLSVHCDVFDGGPTQEQFLSALRSDKWEILNFSDREMYQRNRTEITQLIASSLRHGSIKHIMLMYGQENPWFSWKDFRCDGTSVGLQQCMRLAIEQNRETLTLDCLRITSEDMAELDRFLVGKPKLVARRLETKGCDFETLEKLSLFLDAVRDNKVKKLCLEDAVVVSDCSKAMEMVGLFLSKDVEGFEIKPTELESLWKVKEFLSQLLLAKILDVSGVCLTPLCTHWILSTLAKPCFQSYGTKDLGLSDMQIGSKNCYIRDMLVCPLFRGLTSLRLKNIPNLVGSDDVVMILEALPSLVQLCIIKCGVKYDSLDAVFEAITKREGSIVDFGLCNTTEYDPRDYHDGVMLNKLTEWLPKLIGLETVRTILPQMGVQDGAALRDALVANGSVCKRFGSGSRDTILYHSFPSGETNARPEEMGAF